MTILMHVDDTKGDIDQQLICNVFSITDLSAPMQPLP